MHSNSVKLTPDELVTFILTLSTEQGTYLTGLRLVKFVYLVDLYNSRETNSTVTGWDWFFYNYGPFCNEIFPVLKKLTASSKVISNKFESTYSEGDEYTKYECHLSASEFSRLESLIPSRVYGALRRDIKKYALDSHDLLRYVYFGTEPMQDVRKGDRLDFTKASWPVEIGKSDLKPLKPAEMKKARALIAKLVERVKSNESCISSNSNQVYDAEFDKAVTFMNSDEQFDNSHLKGIAEVLIQRKTKTG